MSELTPAELLESMRSALPTVDVSPSLVSKPREHRHAVPPSRLRVRLPDNLSGRRTSPGSLLPAWTASTIVDMRQVGPARNLLLHSRAVRAAARFQRTC